MLPSLQLQLCIYDQLGPAPNVPEMSDQICFTIAMQTDAQVMILVPCRLQFLMSLVINLLVVLVIPALSFYPSQPQQSPQYQFGHSTLYLEAKLRNQDFQQKEKHFNIGLLNNYSDQSSAVVAIADFQAGSTISGSFGRKTLDIITLMASMDAGRMKVKAAILGNLRKVKMSYLVFQKNFEETAGVKFWNSFSGQSENFINDIQLAILFQFTQKQATNKIGVQEQALDQQASQKEVGVAAILSSLVINDGFMSDFLEIQEMSFQGRIEVKINWLRQPHEEGIKPLFSLALKFQKGDNVGARYMISFLDETKTIHSNQPLAVAEGKRGELFLFGLRQIDNPYSKIDYMQSQREDQVQITINFAQLQNHSSRSLRFTLIKLNPVLQTQVAIVARSLSTSCSAGTYNSTYNWTLLSMASTPVSARRMLWCLFGWLGDTCGNGGGSGGSSGGSTTPCQPCPIGCGSCSAASSCGSMPVTCNSCNSGFTKTYTGTCSGQTYCQCPTNYYPSVYSSTCQSCSTVIANCQSCSTNFFIGTYCASCSPGYYQTYVNATSGYARGCAQCSTACTNCTSATACTACSSNMIVVSGYCTCNTTQNLYYSSSSATCTLCSSVISKCSSCSQSGLTTTCTLCTNGYYVNSTSNTCLLCSTYCTSCTNTTCTSCISSTLSIVGTTCVCPTQTYLNLTSSPPSCIACAIYQPQCTTCSNSSGSVLCSVCASGYFPNSGVCTACLTNCVSCSSTTTCTTCATNFVFNSISGQCECASGYLPNGNTCVLCSDLIPGCQSCNTNPVTCSTCSAKYYNASVNAATCTACPSACSTCTSASTCGTCIVGYSGSDCSTCSTCPTCATLTNVSNCATCATTVCQTCAVGFFLNNTANHCDPCPSTCSSCSSNTTCSSCNSPYVYSSSGCNCNIPLGYYYNTNGATCSLCATVVSYCTSCSGMVSSSGALSTACTACSTGYYLQSSTLCSPCPSNCTQCTSANTCTACHSNFQIIAGLCQCDTNAQYYLNTTSNACDSCTSFISQCTSCEVNANTSTGVGCVTCAVGYYNDVHDSCSQCPPTCVSCSSSTSCINCQNTYSLINGVCACDASVQLFDSGSQCSACYTFVTYCTKCTITATVVTCLTCVNGTYLNTPFNTSCLLCGSNCNSCDASGCISCSLGFVPVNGTCTYTNECQNYTSADSNCVSCALSNTSSVSCLACQAGYYVVNQANCVACPSTCVTCSDYSTCSICASTFTLVNGICTCDINLNQVLLGSVCVSCSSLVANCQTCNSSVAPVECVQPLPTFTLAPNGSCTSCSYGCLTCSQNASCTDCINGFTFQPSTLTCTNSAGCTSNAYYDGSTCISCPSTCGSCLDSSTCVTCSNTFSLINGVCQCDPTQGMFYSPLNSLCNQCGNSTISGNNTTQNCLSCANSTNSLGFQCVMCTGGFFVSGGQCAPCQQGCNECTAANSCYFCQAPIYLLAANGSCICNTGVNYFLNGSACSLCTLQNCTVCTSISTCQSCEPGSFVNSTTQVCQLEICGNGKLQGVQQCDDNNTNDNDGCSSHCEIQQYYVCSNLVEGQISTCLSQKSKFMLQVAEQIVSCNQIQIKLQNTGTESISQCNISNLLADYILANSTLSSYSMENNYLIYTFSYNQTIENETFNFVFDPTKLCVNNSVDFPIFNISGYVKSSNNQPAVYYQQGSCGKLESAKTFVTAVQYASFATLAFSLPSKIVGLQLFGVLQLSHLALGSMDNINLLLQPFASLGSVNGFKLNLGGDKASRLLQTFTPQRINAIDYNANFIRNCNVMFLVTFAVMVVSFVLYLATYICKSCAPTLQKIVKRLAKEVLLTLILFNEFNFAYSAGIHFKYAPSSDPLYFLGTMAAACTLIIPVVMAIALLCSQEEGFGQFKDKLKPGCLQRAYFVVTIIYRMEIGLYMSSANEDELSTLLLLAFSILFLLYNLVNLPFTKAYHNYRANLCHFAQFVTLFVAMFYRSMKSTQSVQESSAEFGPAYCQYVLIVASVVASILVLIYELYLFVKECIQSRKQKNELKQAEEQAPNMSLNQLKQREVNTIQVENIFEGDLQNEKRMDTIGPFEDQQD